MLCKFILNKKSKTFHIDLNKRVKWTLNHKNISSSSKNEHIYEDSGDIL